MVWLRTAGLALVVLSIVGYVVGVWAAYPGRALTITGFMVGVTLYAVGGRA